MRTQTRGQYISRRAWLRDVANDGSIILRGRSALEYLQLFVGYSNETEIDVYATTEGQFENINYYVIDSFDGVDYVRDGNVLCSTVNQAVNDMLSDENTDEMALAEALSDYYHLNNESFGGLNIRPENMQRFEEMKEWAMEYYDEG